MKNPEEMFLVLAAIMPKEEMIKELQNAISKYQSAKDPKEKEKADFDIEMYCLLISSKKMCPDISSIDSVVKQLNELEVQKFPKIDDGLKN